MHSYLLINFTDPNKLAQKIISLSSLNLDLNQFDSHPDIYHIHPTINKKTVNQTASIKIEDIRSLQRKLIRKPLKLTHNLAIIHQAEALTLAAQNSFLKLLEESPESYIFLLSSTLSAFLPTVKSRCQIIIDQQNQATEIDPKAQELFDLLQKSSPIARLTLIEKSTKTTKDAQDLILNFIHIVRNSNNFPLKRGTPNSAKPNMAGCVEEIQTNLTLLENLQTAYSDLQQNINRKLAIDQLCLKWNTKCIKNH